AADPDLLRRGALQPQVQHLDAQFLEQGPQLLSARISGQRRDQTDRAAVGRGQPGGKTGASRPGPLVEVLDDGHRRVGTEPFDATLDIPVQQAVAYHQQGGRTAVSHHPATCWRPAPPSRASTAASTAAQSRWMATKCTSWTTAVGPETATASSQHLA